MSSTEDNVVSKRAAVTRSIEQIKENKQKILTTLKAVSENGEPDKELMAKLVDAFDTLSTQEQKYMGVLVDIATIHEQATSDVAKDYSEAIDKLKNVSNEKKQPVDDGDDENDVAEMKLLAKELAETQAQALAASLLNEQLELQMSQQKNKSVALNEFRKATSKDVQKRSEEALRDVQSARIRVTGERQENDRKAKQLERLRRKALEKGIQLGKEEEKKKDELVAQVEQSPIRIPVLDDKKEDAGSNKSEKTQEEKRKEIKQQIKMEKERRDNLHAQLHERFAAMDARKNRMNTIRQMLNQMSNIDKKDESPNIELPSHCPPLASQEELELTYHCAQAKLRNLTAMRERLEQIQASGGNFIPEDESIINALQEEGDKTEQKTTDEPSVKEEEVRSSRTHSFPILVVRSPIIWITC